MVLLSVALLCVTLLSAGLTGLQCRYHADSWLASENSILCFVGPGLILLTAIAGVSTTWWITHEGLAAVTAGVLGGAVAIVATSVFLWVVLSRRIRGSRG